MSNWTEQRLQRLFVRYNRRFWAGGPDLSMMAEAGTVDPTDETFREYERVVDPKYLDEIRAAAEQFSTNLLSRQSRVAKCTIRNLKNGKNTIKPDTLRKLTSAIHDLQNKRHAEESSCIAADIRARRPHPSMGSPSRALLIPTASPSSTFRSIRDG